MNDEQTQLYHLLKDAETALRLSFGLARRGHQAHAKTQRLRADRCLKAAEELDPSHRSRAWADIGWV